MVASHVLRAALLLALTWLPALAGETQPSFLRDRGAGVPTSMFGTYIAKGELFIYPFYERYVDANSEYQPDEFGYGSAQEYRAKYSANEGILFIGYGLTDRIVLEFEGAFLSAQQEKAGSDTTAMPEDIEETGLGDVQTQINWLMSRETAARPALFSFMEIVYPLQKHRSLIGTQDWEIKTGFGIVRGFSWGTVTFRAATEYVRAESKLDIGEFALEYLRRLSQHWRIYAGVEGTQDEVSLITEAQWHISPNVYLKLNNGLGLTAKATDWAPEVGFVFALPR